MKIKIKRVVLLVFIILLLFELLLIFRYSELKVITNLLGFILIISSGIFLLSFSFQKWKDLVNPISLYFVFIFGFAYSLLELTKYFKVYNFLSFLVIVLSIFCFVIGALSNIRFKSPFQSIIFSQRSSLISYIIILIISFFSFIVEIIHIGYLPILKIFSFDIYNDTNTKLVSFLHYFVMLFAIIPSWTYILYKNDKLKKRILVFVLIFSAFAILNYLSRQIIILFMLSSLVSYTFYNKLNIRQLLVYGVGIICFFFIVGQFRMSQIDVIKDNALYSTNQYLKNSAGIESETNVIESTYVLYSSIRYYNLHDFINKAQIDGYSGFGKYIFKPIISITFLDRLGLIRYNPEFDVNSALATYAIDPYLDFGIIGVILLGFIYGVASTHFYIHYKSGQEQYIVSWSLIIFCLIMTSFMNYFSTFFVFFVWGINKLIIINNS